MSASGKFAVRVSLHARHQFQAMKERATASPGSAHDKTWRVICDIVRTRLTQGEIALDANHALRGPLAKVYRWKFARSRCAYLVSSERQQVTILLVGLRKEGAQDDVYAELTRRLRAGEFDEYFSELGITKPTP